MAAGSNPTMRPVELNAFISRSDETGSGERVAVKDLVDVKGMVTTAGGIILPKVPATNDAPVVKRIRAAGGVIVGKTNLHEFAYGVTNINPHYGTALNPHDPGRISGGSSGGSAVAVAAGMCDWAVGSDTGGSIRIPSSLCGVVGFKPDFASIEVDGVIPLSPSLDTLGPMARDVATTARAFAVMSGEEVSLGDLSRPRLGIPRGWVTGLDEPTAAAWAPVAKGLQEVDFIDREPLFEVGLTILLFEAAASHRRWATETPEKYGEDVLRLIRRGFDVSEADYQAAVAERSRVEAAARAAVDEIGTLILPATAIVAPLIDAGPEVREPLSRFTRPFNTTHQPVVVLPLSVAGLPVGVQVVGRTNVEALRAAAWLEASWT